MAVFKLAMSLGRAGGVVGRTALKGTSLALKGAAKAGLMSIGALKDALGGFKENEADENEADQDATPISTKSNTSNVTSTQPLNEISSASENLDSDRFFAEILTYLRKSNANLENVSLNIQAAFDVISDQLGKIDDSLITTNKEVAKETSFNKKNQTSLLSAVSKMIGPLGLMLASQFPDKANEILSYLKNTFDKIDFDKIDSKSVYGVVGAAQGMQTASEKLKQKPTAQKVKLDSTKLTRQQIDKLKKQGITYDEKAKRFKKRVGKKWSFVKKADVDKLLSPSQTSKIASSVADKVKKLSVTGMGTVGKFLKGNALTSSIFAFIDGYKRFQEGESVENAATTAISGLVTSLAGMKVGAAGGAALGSFVGPVGTVVGAIGGGVAGSILGYSAGEKIAEPVKDFAKEKIMDILPASPVAVPDNDQIKTLSEQNQLDEVSAEPIVRQQTTAAAPSAPVKRPTLSIDVSSVPEPTGSLPPLDLFFTSYA